MATSYVLVIIPILAAHAAAHVGRTGLLRTSGVRGRLDPVGPTSIPPLPLSPSASPGVANNNGTVPCSMLAGLLSADLSPQCCFSAQVLMQRGLHMYGMAQPCKAAWSCQTDGITPLPQFERQAQQQLCAESGCMNSVASAMRANWMTKQGASMFAGVCDHPISATEGTAPAMSWITRAAGAEGPAAADDKPPPPKKKFPLACFPGHAEVIVQGRGKVEVGALTAGDSALIGRPDGSLAFEPVLGFLHAVRGQAHEFLEVTHERGVLRVSPGHLVFVRTSEGRVSKVAWELQIGDELLATPGGVGSVAEASAVTAVRRKKGTSGMFAPFTMSGTIVVDEVVASNYASPSESVRLPHSIAHAMLAPLRVYHALGLPQVFSALAGNVKGNGEHLEEMHPYVAMMHDALGVWAERILPTIATLPA